MPQVERPLRQVNQIRQPRRIGEALLAIGLAAAGLTALLVPWVVPLTRPSGETAEQRSDPHDQPRTAVKVPRAIETIPLPAAPGSTDTVAPETGRPVAEEDGPTVAPPRAAPLAKGPPDDPVLAPTDDAAPVKPAPREKAVLAPPDTATVPAPPVTEAATPVAEAANPSLVPEASLVTGSLAVPDAPPKTTLGSEPPPESKRRPSLTPLPKAFKPSVERSPLREPHQRRASLPEPTLVPRAHAPVSRAPVRSQVSPRTTSSPQPRAAPPSSVVLPNSLLPFGANSAP